MPAGKIRFSAVQAAHAAAHGTGTDIDACTFKVKALCVVSA
jgi:hypothetical protein